MKDENKDMEELVQVVDKQLVTSSVTVARNFEKRHDHVIRDIEVYKKMFPTLGRCSTRGQPQIPMAVNRKHIS